MRIVKGDVVEYESPYDWTVQRVGIVTSVGPSQQIILVTEFMTGRQRILEAADATIVHGYLHIDRPRK